MDMRKVYQEKVEAQLNEWGKKLETLRAMARNKTADAKVAFAEQWDHLQKRYEELKMKWEEAQATSDDKWEGVKAGIEKTIAEVKAAFQKHSNQGNPS